MNITEKKRAEEMVNSWSAREQMNAIAKFKNFEVPAKVEKEVKDAGKAIDRAYADYIKVVEKYREQGYILSDNVFRNRGDQTSVSVRVSPANPEQLKVNEARDKAQQVVVDKAKALIVDVWDNKHTFESLAKELT